VSWAEWLGFPEVEFWDLGYAAKCRGKGGRCGTTASVLARGVDVQGRYERQVELCGDHAAEFQRRRAIKDRRRAARS
jgi:hypothetical protein